MTAHIDSSTHNYWNLERNCSTYLKRAIAWRPSMQNLGQLGNKRIIHYNPTRSRILNHFFLSLYLTVVVICGSGTPTTQIIPRKLRPTNLQIANMRRVNCDDVPFMWYPYSAHVDINYKEIGILLSIPGTEA